jgi:capsular polysaccharide export protein
VRYRHSFLAEMVRELLYHCGNCLLRPLHPFFQSGRYYNALAEFLVGIPHVLRARAHERDARAVIAALVEGKAAYHMVALQLQGDHQIHSNSPYSHLGQMIDEVIASFAAHAPAAMQLVFKQHPHDNGAENWPRHVAAAAARHGISARVLFVDGGDLSILLANARGCVMVNSTVGLSSIRTRCPTKLLGIAVYDLPGLTHQGSLDSFWTAPEPVDPALADAFVRALAARVQVKGSFFNPDGRRVAIAEIVRRMQCGLINGADADIRPAPRIAQAMRMGVRVDQSSRDSTSTTRPM